MEELFAVLAFVSLALAVIAAVLGVLAAVFATGWISALAFLICGVCLVEAALAFGIHDCVPAAHSHGQPEGWRA